MGQATDLADCSAARAAGALPQRRRLAGRGDAGGAGAHRPARSGAERLLPSSPPTRRSTRPRGRARRAGSRGAPAGELDGVPVSIKDLILAKGWPTLRGSRTVDPKQAWDVDAPATARLREAGAVILGKTTTPEFGCKGETNSPLTGITRNPWNPAKTPGGSSGGTAAAVAAGMGPLSVGTDGAGSVRIPAGFCGNFGLKPSFGRVPAYPLSPMGTVAHLGPHTMSVADAALMMNVLKRPDARDWTSLPYDDRDYLQGLDDGVRGLRIAFSPTLGYAQQRRIPRSPPPSPPRCASSRGWARRSRPSTRASPIRSRSPPACGSPARRRSGAALTPEQQTVVDPDFRAEAELGARYSALDLHRLNLRRGDARLAPAPVHAALRPDRHADAGRAGLRRPPRRAHADAAGGDARLDAVQLPVQPQPAAGLHHPLRPDERRPADRPAAGRADVRRRARAARGPRLRDGAADPAAAAGRRARADATPSARLRSRRASTSATVSSSTALRMPRCAAMACTRRSTRSMFGAPADRARAADDGVTSEQRRLGVLLEGHEIARRRAELDAERRTPSRRPRGSSRGRRAPRP